MKHTVVVCFVSLTHPDQINCFNEESIETAEKTTKTTSYIANEAKTGNKNEFDYSL